MRIRSCTGEPLAAALKRAFFRLYDGPPAQNTKALVLLRQANYLEDLAILAQEQTVGRKFVAKSLGYIIVSRWAMWQDVADEFRRRNKGLDNFPAFRQLADELRGDPDLA